MQFLDLPRDVILLTLEELDPRALFQLSKASSKIYRLVLDYESLQYRYELALTGMKDGPPSLHPISLRLQHLLGYKSSWPKLRWSHEDILRIPAPTVMGISDQFFYHASTDGAGNPLSSILELYELRSFRTDRIALPLRYRKFRVSFKVHRVAIDTAQELLVLVQIYQSPVTSAVSARLHFCNLWTCKIHAEASIGQFELNTDWSGDLSSAGHCIRAQQVEICGRWVGLSMHYEANGGEGTTEVVVINWKQHSITRCYEDQIMSFQFLDESHIILASQPDEDEEAESDIEEDVFEDYSSSTPGTQGASLRPPCLILCVLGPSALIRQGIYEFPLAWGGAISSIEIVRNACPTSDDEMRMQPGTFFFPDPTSRRTVVSVEFVLGRIPVGWEQEAVLVIPGQFFTQLRENQNMDDILMPWSVWSTACLIRDLGTSAHSFCVAGQRLVFLETTHNRVRPVQGPFDQLGPFEPRSRVRLLDLNPHAVECMQPPRGESPPWAWFGNWTTVTAVQATRGCPYIRTCTADMYDLTWFKATIDNLLLFDEYEDVLVIRILTFGEVPRGVSLLKWDLPGPRSTQ